MYFENPNSRPDKIIPAEIENAFSFILLGSHTAKRHHGSPTTSTKTTTQSFFIPKKKLLAFTPETIVSCKKIRSSFIQSKIFVGHIFLGDPPLPNVNRHTNHLLTLDRDLMPLSALELDVDGGRYGVIDDLGGFSTRLPFLHLLALLVVTGEKSLFKPPLIIPFGIFSFGALLV